MSDQPITKLLHAASSGDADASRRLYDAIYDHLRRQAHVIRAAHSDGTIATTELVHEAYMKLSSGGGVFANDRVHFFRIAARAMRQVLVDSARRREVRLRFQREAQASDREPSPDDGLAIDVIALDEALRELETVRPRQASVVECRFFAGLSVEDTAEALAISPPTVKRDWRLARAFLAEALARRIPSAQ